MDDQEKRLARLAELAGGDAGALIRGLHSFMEDFLREKAPPGSGGRSFAERLAGFAESEESRTGTAKRRAADARAADARGLDTRTAGLVKRLAAEHELAYRGAWSAVAPDSNEAAAAAHNFLQFCELAGIDSPSLAALRSARDTWRRRTAAESEEVLRDLQAEVVASQADDKKIVEQTAQWAEDKKRLAELEGEAMRLQAALKQVSARPQPDAARVEEIRAEVRALEERRAGLNERLSSYRDLDLYVQNVSRFSLYTRSRRDYERGLLELTPEQREAVDAMRRVTTCWCAERRAPGRPSCSSTRWPGPWPNAPGSSPWARAAGCCS